MHAPITKDAEALGGFGELLLGVNEAAHAAGKYLAISLDEFHNADVDSLRTLIAAVHQSARSSRPILLASAGLPQSHVLLDRSNTYVRRWDQFDVSFLSRAEEIDGLRGPARAAGVTIEDRVVDLVVAESGGYPYSLQKYGSVMWRFEKNDSIDLSGDLAAAIDATRRSLEKTYYARSIDDLPDRERRFVVALAQLGPGPHALGTVAAKLGVASSALGSIRARLIKKDVIFVPGSGKVQFRMPLTERYVSRNHERLRPVSGESS